MLDIDNILSALLAALVLGMACLFFTGIYSLTQDHSVRQYYVGDPQRVSKGVVVMAEVNWGEDLPVYTTDDIDKAIDAMNRLNAALPAIQR